MTSVREVRTADRSPRLHGDAAAAATARIALTIAVVANAALLALLVLLAVLVDNQSDILANQSEAGGGFDPSVFPPHNDAIWVLANGAAAVAVLVLIVLVVVRIAVRRRTDS